MPRAFNFSSKFEPINLSGPFWRTHSPSPGVNPGSITSPGVAMPLLPTRLYHTIAPAFRAASFSRLTLGTVVTQRGRAPQLAFIMSRMSRAVVEPSSVTGLSSGGGGAFAVAQSSRISEAKDDAANAIMIVIAAVAAPRNRVRIFNIVLSLDLSNTGRLTDRVLHSTFCRIVRFHCTRHNEFVTTAVPDGVSSVFIRHSRGTVLLETTQARLAAY